MTSKDRKPTTTDAGIPVASDEHSLSVGPNAFPSASPTRRAAVRLVTSK